jgi:hypothetical protein
MQSQRERETAPPQREGAGSLRGRHCSVREQAASEGDTAALGSRQPQRETLMQLIVREQAASEGDTDAAHC